MRTLTLALAVPLALGVAASIRRAEHRAAEQVTVDPGSVDRPWGTWAVGPVPDYAPTAFVVTHERVADLAPGLPAVLDRHLGAAHLVDRTPTPDARAPYAPIWLRDAQPMHVRRADSVLTGVKPLHPEQFRETWLPPIPGPTEPWSLIPLIHEHGNLVSTSRHAFVSDRILSENQSQFPDPRLTEAGYRPRRPRETLSILAQALERPIEDIVVLPAPPGEGSAHIDAALLPLDDRTIMVPEIRAEALAVSDDPASRALALAARDGLEVLASALRALDYQVPRWPMLPPLRLPSVDRAGALEVAWYTPANSLLLVREGGRVVLLPAVRPEALPPRAVELDLRYQAEWRSAATSHGFAVELIDVTALLPYGGLHRCVSAVVPAP